MADLRYVGPPTPSGSTGLVPKSYVDTGLAGKQPAGSYASTTHASTHSTGGSDPVTPAAIGAAPATGPQRVTCSTAQTYTSTTAVDVPGLTVTVTSPGTTASWLVMVTLDVNVTAAQTVSFIGQLLVDGTAQASQVIAYHPTAFMRTTINQTYLVTGLAAGAHVMKVSGNLTGTGSYSIGNTHSTETVIRVA